MRATNEQVKRFYKDKNPNPSVTSAYMSTGYGQRTKGYVDFANICMQHGNVEPKTEEGKKQLKNYEDIENNIECRKGEHDLSYLDEIKDIPKLDIKQKEDINQKWHLYVSLFAQLVVESSDSIWEKDFKKYPSFLLKLWMAENAGVNIDKIRQAIFGGKSKSEINSMIRELSWDEIFDKITKNECSE